MKKTKEISIKVDKKSSTSTTIKVTYTDKDFKREATFTITVNQNEIICTDNNNEEEKVTFLDYFKYWLSKMLITFVIECKIHKLLEEYYIPLNAVGKIDVDPEFEKAIAYIRLPNKIGIGIYFLARLEKLKITHVSIGLPSYAFRFNR